MFLWILPHSRACPLLSQRWLPSIQRNEIRNLTAHLLTEVCHNVAVEPHLQSLPGETLNGTASITQDGARLDVAADGFWESRFERAFFDVKVFNPYARSNQRSTLAATYRSHENSKKRGYDQRIREVNMEHLPHWFSPAPVVWVVRPQPPTGDWLP